ncbi:MAG TPA: arylesterase [Segetibacter sp.]|nr:arylesterase [Segetibacter sp.]
MNKILPFICVIFFMIVVSCDNKQATPEAGKQSAKNDSPVNKSQGKTILFFGNSLTAGFGVDPSEAFPAVIQNKIDSLNLPYKVVNAGVSGETSSGGNGRIDWILRQPLNIFVLELGANDGLRGIPLDETKKNLQAIIDKVKAKYPDAKLVLAGMQIPPNMGQKYANEFKDMFPQLAQKNSMTLIPFLLQGVGGEVKLNQQDGIHPTEEGHKIVAENVWRILKDML